jgi:hypothetical protein
MRFVTTYRCDGAAQPHSGTGEKANASVDPYGRPVDDRQRGVGVRSANTRAAYIVAAMSGILADWFLKFLLAPTWGRWLRALLP